MSDIIENIVGFFWQIIKFAVYNVIWEGVLFNVGRFSLLLVTFGQFPRAKHLDKYSDLINITGIIVLVALWVAIAIYNNWSHIVGVAP